jgi:hypothetical protein
MNTLLELEFTLAIRGTARRLPMIFAEEILGVAHSNVTINSSVEERLDLNQRP